MNEFSGKTALVIGGGGSIGAATAALLAQRGARVMIGDVDENAAQRVAKTIADEGGVAVGEHCDIGDEASIKTFIDHAIKIFDGIDLLHANAADTVSMAGDTNVVDTPLDIVKKTVNVNFIGTFLCARYAIPRMLERGGGSIVFTTSEAAFGVVEREPIYVTYAMTKAAIGALARNISSRWGKAGIRANCVCPGLIMSDRAKSYIGVDDGHNDFLENAKRRLNATRLGEPADIANATLFLLSDNAEYINGQTLRINGGQYY